MATKPPRENVASTGEPGEVLATTQLQVRALGLTGALMQNITAIAPAITAFFFTATIVGFTGAISPFAYFLGFLVVLALGMCLVQQKAGEIIDSQTVTAEGAETIADTGDADGNQN